MKRWIILLVLLTSNLLFGQDFLLKQLPVTITKNASIHTKASDFTAPVGKVKKGETYTCLNQKNGFYQIELKDGTIGWVRNWHAKIPLVKNAVLVSGRLMTEKNIRSEIIIELRLNVSAMLLKQEGKWYRVRLADGREGWIRNVRTVISGILYSQRAGRLLNAPQFDSRQLDWVEAGSRYVPLEYTNGWYKIAVESGKIGWMDRPQLPVALKAKNRFKLALNDDLRHPKGAQISKGTIVEPLDYFKKKYMVRTSEGIVGFAARGAFLPVEPEQATFVAETQVFAKPDKKTAPLTRLSAMSTVTVLGKKGAWQLLDLGGGKTGWAYLEQQKKALQAEEEGYLFVAANGKLLAEPDTDAEEIRNVKKGQKIKKKSIYGQYYEVTTEDGVVGWLPTHLVKPVPSEASIMMHSCGIVSDHKSQEGKNLIIGKAAKWDTVYQLEKVEGKTKIKTKDGVVGWVNQRWVRPEGQVREGAVAFLYHPMWWLYAWYQNTGFFGSLLYYLIVLLWLCVPFVLGYLAAYGIAKIRLLPNLPVKLIGSVLIFFIALVFLGNTHWYRSYPPMEFSPTLQMLGQILGMIIFIGSFWSLIYRHRCRYCHKMWTVEITDVQHIGTVHNTETTTYTDGSKSKKRWTNKKYLVTYHCVDCDKSWTMEETYTSGGHN